LSELEYHDAELFLVGRIYLLQQDQHFIAGPRIGSNAFPWLNCHHRIKSLIPSDIIDPHLKTSGVYHDTNMLTDLNMVDGVVTNMNLEGFLA